MHTHASLTMTPRFTPTRLASATLLLLAGAAQAQSIGTLQGTSHVSSFANVAVSNIAGIVTAVDNNGFWMQDAGDGNLLTSDAIYVFRGSTGTKPTVGSDVRVAGNVQEFRPGGDATNLTITQINATSAFAGSFTLVSVGNPFPTAVSIGGSLLPPRAIAPALGNIETAPGYVLQPTQYAMDFYESLEGMRVTLPSAITSGPTMTGNYNGDTAVYAGTSPWASSRGGLVVGEGNFNGDRWFIDNRITAAPSVNSGATLANITGVVDYSFNNYRLVLTQSATVVTNPLLRETAAIPSGHFGLASYNVENLGGNATPARFTAIAGQIAGNLGAPHLISLQEVQDNNGATNNGTVAADVTLNSLAGALNTATGRSYAWVTINPVNNADGGQTGGNIRQAFMYDTSRVSFAGVVGGSLEAITATGSATGQILLSLGAGRIDPTNSAFANSRKPLVTEFTVDGQQIIVIANHFNSKGGDQPLFGPTQPPVEGTAVQRREQAQVVASFVQQLLAINPNANIVVTGDLNDFQFAESLEPLVAAGLFNLTELLPENERYTYSFQGNLQQLDHMFVSPNMRNASSLAFDIVHANSEFVDQTSDHDPILMTMAFVPAPVPEPATWLTMALGVAALVARVRRQR
jgi:uncharacterized protein